MEDLLTLANELMKDDTYKKNDFVETKPDGDYLVNIDSIELKESEKGTQWFSIKTTILDGEYLEKSFYISWFLTEKTVKRTISSIMNLITSSGYELDPTMFADFETLSQCLQSLVNTQAHLNKKTSGEYINYKLVGGAE